MCASCVWCSKFEVVAASKVAVVTLIRLLPGFVTTLMHSWYIYVLFCSVSAEIRNKYKGARRRVRDQM